MSDLSPDDHNAFMQAAAEIELCAEDRIEEMQQWIVSHPAEVLALLAEAGVLAKRWMSPEGRYISVSRSPGEVAWTVHDDPAGIFPPPVEVFTRVDDLPPLIGEETEEGGSDGE